MWEGKNFFEAKTNVKKTKNEQNKTLNHKL